MVGFEHHVVEIRDHIGRVDVGGVALEALLVLGGERVLWVVDSGARRPRSLDGVLIALRGVDGAVDGTRTTKADKCGDTKDGCYLLHHSHVPRVTSCKAM